MSDPTSSSPPTASRRPIFDPTVNLGHVLTFVGFIATGFLAYSTLDKRLAVQEQKSVAQELRQHEQELRVKESLNEIKGDVKEVQRSLNDLNRNLSQTRHP
ncbi:hypothetical protein [Caldimonas brevitalea]|uniref:Uncharacterized protein n=1 Tax=Caldimonas brevitalea TaxID=413882 RepID=A0A0G3BNC4_9BURK|nr:hypothetical protein [Caldimonas brevitalea]AKJ28851.1 hypothetical protein AAW51_2160 [Caldimonas brevitalea]